MSQSLLLICGTDEDRYNLSKPQFSHLRVVSEGPDVWKPAQFDAVQFYHTLMNKIQTKELTFDGVVGTDEMPACLLASMIAHATKKPGPHPHAVLRCQNKFVARQLLSRVMQEAIPTFTLLNSHTPRLPFFIKPVKGELSLCAGAVKTLADLEQFLAQGKHLPQYFSSFNRLMRLNKFEGPDGHLFMTEEIRTGHQVTVDGYVHKGNVQTTTIYDSILYPGTLSFKSFNTPSTLPTHAQHVLQRLAKKAITTLQLDSTCFNIEFFYNTDTDTPTLIEVNPRMASQFADLTEKVYGTNPYELQVALALGEKPHFNGKGKQSCAASIPFRVFENKHVLSVPSASDISALKKDYPDVFVQVLVKPGDNLSDYPQDTNSFRYCLVNIAADSHEELDRIAQECKKRLPFSFAQPS